MNQFEFRRENDQGVFYLNGVRQPWACSEIRGASVCKHPETGSKHQIFVVEVDTPQGAKNTLSIDGRPPRNDEMFSDPIDPKTIMPTSMGVEVQIGDGRYLFNWPGGL